MNAGMTCPHCGEHIGPRPGEILTLGRLTINTETREVFVDGALRFIGNSSSGTKCPGRGKEFTILAELARNPGRVYSRDDLMDVTDTWDSAPHVIEVWLSHIRAGVGDVAEIRNYWGAGWSLHERQAEFMDA